MFADNNHGKCLQARAFLVVQPVLLNGFTTLVPRYLSYVSSCQHRLLKKREVFEVYCFN